MPSYEQKRFDDGTMHNKLRLVASPGGEDGALTIHQDVAIFLVDWTQAVSLLTNSLPDATRGCRSCEVPHRSTAPS